MVKRITSNDEIPGSIPGGGKLSTYNCFLIFFDSAIRCQDFK